MHSHFEVDRHDTARVVIDALAKKGRMTDRNVAKAIKLYNIDAEKGSSLIT